jgi:hypothetical protein
MAGRLDALDDPDYPAYTTGRAAEVLGVRQAFLDLEDDLAAERALTARLHHRPGGRNGPDG